MWNSGAFDLQLVHKLCPQASKNVSVYERIYYSGHDNSVGSFKSLDEKMMFEQVKCVHRWEQFYSLLHLM